MQHQNHNITSRKKCEITVDNLMVPNPSAHLFTINKRQIGYTKNDTSIKNEL